MNIHIDYTNLSQCVELAKKMSGTIVVKHDGRPNYNITHASRTDLYRPDEVVWPTPRN